jgi:hypothetical protein
MSFVADESCAAPVIRALHEAGHDNSPYEEPAKHKQVAVKIVDDRGLESLKI